MTPMAIRKAKIRTVMGAALLLGLLAAAIGCNEETSSTHSNSHDNLVNVPSESNVKESTSSPKKVAPESNSVAQSFSPQNSPMDSEKFASEVNPTSVGQPPVAKSGIPTGEVNAGGGSPPAEDDLSAEEYAHLSQLMAEEHNTAMGIIDNMTPCTKYVDPGCY